LAFYKIGSKEKAINDWKLLADLYSSQGKTAKYNEITALIKKHQ